MSARDVWTSPTPLDRASFYVEELKYGPGPGQVEAATDGQVAAQLETLLRDAGVTTMTGKELMEATRYYGDSLGRSFGTSPIVALSCFMDGLMHGIALAGGLEGEPRNPPGRWKP